MALWTVCQMLKPTSAFCAAACAVTYQQQDRPARTTHYHTCSIHSVAATDYRAARRCGGKFVNFELPYSRGFCLNVFRAVNARCFELFARCPDRQYFTTEFALCKWRRLFRYFVILCVSAAYAFYGISVSYATFFAPVTGRTAARVWNSVNTR